MLYYTKINWWFIIYLITGDKMNQEKLNYIIGKNIKKYRNLYNQNGQKMTQEKLAELINVLRYIILK